jgi:hypothetical protein
MPPPYRHLSTLIVKVGRPWAGIVRFVPHGAYSAGKCNGMRRICGNGGRAAGWYAPSSVSQPGEAAGEVRGLPRYGAGGRPWKDVPGIGVTAD